MYTGNAVNKASLHDPYVQLVTRKKERNKEQIKKKEKKRKKGLKEKGRHLKKIEARLAEASKRAVCT